MEHWGRYFRALRESRGLTQDAVELAGGWKERTGSISRFEGRSTPPSHATIARLARAIGCSEGIVRGDGEKDDPAGPQVSHEMPITDQPPADQESATVTDPILAAVIDLWHDLSPRTRKKILNLASADTTTTETHRERGRGLLPAPPRTRRAE